MSSLFLAFVAATAGLVALSIARWLPRRQARRALLGLAAWLAYAGLLSYFGVIRDPAMRPPGPTLLVAPVVLFVILFLVRSEAAGRIAASVPLAVLLVPRPTASGSSCSSTSFGRPVWRHTC